MSKPHNILITGGTGYVGGRLIPLVHDRDNVRLRLMARKPEYLRARVEPGSSGPLVTRYPNQSSGMLSSACWADGLAVVPENTTINEGDTITYYSFRELMG